MTVLSTAVNHISLSDESWAASSMGKSNTTICIGNHMIFRAQFGINKLECNLWSLKNLKVLIYSKLHKKNHVIYGFLRCPTMIDSCEERNRWYKFNFNESARYRWRNSTRFKTLNCNHPTNQEPEIKWDNVRKWLRILVDVSKNPKCGYKFNVSGVLGQHCPTPQAQYCDKEAEHRWLPSTQRICMCHNWQGTLSATLLYYSRHPLETSFSVLPSSEMGKHKHINCTCFVGYCVQFMLRKQGTNFMLRKQCTYFMLRKQCTYFKLRKQCTYFMLRKQCTYCLLRKQCT